LLAMVIKKYLKSHSTSANKIRFCMQLLRHEGKLNIKAYLLGKTHYYLSLNKQTKLD
jgi:hypothetical protein